VSFETLEGREVAAESVERQSLTDKLLAPDPESGRWVEVREKKDASPRQKPVPKQAGAGAPDMDGARLLDDVAGYIRRFVIFHSDRAPAALALWVLHAHCIDAADHTPYLKIHSPQPESGKSRTLEVLNELVPRPFHVIEPSEAVVYREVDANKPTLLLDEVDAIFNKLEHEGLRALLNAGHSRGTSVPRCVGQGTAMTTKRFPTFCAKALAGIGNLPHTVETRSIPIMMTRKTRDEEVERFRLRQVGKEAHRLRSLLEAWAACNLELLSQAEPELPDELTDRQQDGWEPLLAIADAAGAVWGKRARAAAIALHGRDENQPSEDALLLQHIRDEFGGRQQLSTEAILRALVDRDDGPWAERWARLVEDDKTRGPAAQLAKQLRPYGPRPKKIRIGEATMRGYNRSDFEDSWARYLPPLGDGTHATDGTSQVGVTRDVPSVASVPSSAGGGTSETTGTSQVGASEGVSLPGHVSDTNETGQPNETGHEPVTRNVTHVSDVSPSRPRGTGSGVQKDWTYGHPLEPCEVCRDDCEARTQDGRVIHPTCQDEGL